MQASAVQPQSISISSTWPEHCKRWVGQVVESRFHLRQYLGGTEHSAVFLTKPSDRRHEKAAIRFIKSDPRTDDEQLARWQRLRHMQCPGLLEIYEYGRCDIGDAHLLFVVEEFADETLAGVLAERALTHSEVEQMLPAVLETLTFLHSKGLAYSRLKPSNVMAVGERLKLSPECALAFGTKSRWADLGPYAAPELLTGVSAATDVWALGSLLCAALTQSADTPETTVDPPYNVLLAGCKATDPETRSSVSHVREMIAPEVKVISNPTKSPARNTETRRTEPVTVAAPEQQEPASDERSQVSALLEQLGTKRIIAGAGALVLVFLAIMVGTSLRPKHTSTAAPQVIAQTPVHARPVVQPASTPAPAAQKLTATADPVTLRTSPSGAVLHEALPRVPQSASNTITGTVRVKVRVAVDSNGKVRDAEFDQAGPSKYFARLSMEAARDWQFSPKVSQGMWILNFNYRNNGPSASATPAS
jgi:TonB family protein